MILRTLAVLTALLPGLALAGSTRFTTLATKGADLWATMKTSEGEIVLKLFSKDAPKTVANFVGLATGEKDWTSSDGKPMKGKPLYDGVIFHRVIPDFMIQGGDPTGSGRGDPGYRFEDEVQSGRTFEKVGLLAMANSGPGPEGKGTNGCQFFITTSTPHYLDNKHTIFGEVVSGYDVVVKITNVPRSQTDRPNTEVKILKVTITDKAPKLPPPPKEKAL